MDCFSLLRARMNGLWLERDFSFAAHTSIGCGGIAAACARPADAAELCKLLAFLGREAVPYCFLGAGNNVLPADGFFDGVVICFSRMNGIASDGLGIVCGAGVSAGKLLRFAEERGIGGLEFLTGIPASVGGAAVMNAGVREGHLADVVFTVTGIQNGEIREFSREECKFSEKYSIFQGGIAVTGVYLRGTRSTAEEIRKKRQDFSEKRKRLPKGKSMGCVFVNPAGMSAGALIEDCGLKGLRVGNAYVSEAHANFIINGGAASAEIEALISMVKERVFRKTGILLREEIKRIPNP